MAEESKDCPALQSSVFKTLLSAWSEMFRVWRQKRHDCRQLNLLSDSGLKDLAIDRSEIPSIVHAGTNERRRNHGD